MNKSQKCSLTQRGRVVIHKDDVEKRVYRDELDSYISDGWILGITEQHRKNTSSTHLGKESWCKGQTKYTNESLMRASKKLSKRNKGILPWNTGLTIDDPRVRDNVNKSTKTKIERYGSGFPNNNMDTSHKEKISTALMGNKNGCGIRDPSVGKKISEKKKGHIVTQETRKKISDSKKGKRLSSEKLEIKLTKEYLTKKKNNSFHTSEPERKLYDKLLKENVNKTIYRQYKESRYPYYCDFYIKEDDLFIELNAHWTHGGKPFDPKDPDCIKQLSEWEQKAETSEFYKNAIFTWTIRDVEKQKCAKDNNLNYITIY